MLRRKYWRRTEQVGYSAFGYRLHSFPSVIYLHQPSAPALQQNPSDPTPGPHSDPFCHYLHCPEGTLKAELLTEGTGLLSRACSQTQLYAQCFWPHSHWLIHQHSDTDYMSIQTSRRPLGGFPLTSTNSESDSFVSPRNTFLGFPPWTVTYQSPDTKWLTSHGCTSSWHCSLLGFSSPNIMFNLVCFHSNISWHQEPLFLTTVSNFQIPLASPCCSHWLQCSQFSFLCGFN